MTRYEYKVVPAPKKGEKARGVKTPEDRFAHALASLMNRHGAEGWEYLRTDTLPAEERTGFTGRTTVFQNMLVFRRVVEVEAPRAALPQPIETGAAAPLPGAAPSLSGPTPGPTLVPAAARAPAAEPVFSRAVAAAREAQQATVVPVRRGPDPGGAPRLGPAQGGVAGE